MRLTTCLLPYPGAWNIDGVPYFSFLVFNRAQRAIRGPLYETLPNNNLKRAYSSELNICFSYSRLVMLGVCYGRDLSNVATIPWACLKVIAWAEVYSNWNCRDVLFLVVIICRCNALKKLCCFKSKKRKRQRIINILLLVFGLNKSHAFPSNII